MLLRLYLDTINNIIKAKNSFLPLGKMKCSETEVCIMHYVIVIMGKSLSGKSYLQKELVKQGFPKMITATTRPKRQGEVDGQDYYFVDKMAEDAIAPRKYHVVNNQEWDYYLPKDEFVKVSSTNQVSTLILDLDGYLELEKASQNMPNVKILGLYLNVPLKERLRRYLDTSRGQENSKEFVRRLYDDEMRAFNQLDDPKFCQEHHVMLMDKLNLICEVLNDLSD